MIMWHEDATVPIDVHPTRIEEMKRKGWTEEEPKKATTKKPKEDNSDGES